MGIIKKNFCPNVFPKCFGLRISNQLSEFHNVNFEEGFAQFCAQEKAINQDQTITDRKVKKHFSPNVFGKFFGLRISNQLLEFPNVNFEEGFAQFCAQEKAINQDQTGTDGNNQEKFLSECFPKMFWPEDLKSIVGISECQF